MILPRIDHSLVFLNEEIFALGGFSQEFEKDIEYQGFTPRCEKFVVQTKTWVEIAELKNPCHKFSTCTFNNRWIYKFGGKVNYKSLCQTIDRYDTFEDVWQNVPLRFELHYNSNFNLLSYSGSVQISENEILVFGGTDEEYKKSQMSFVLRLRDQNSHMIEKIIDESLPVGEGFWSQQILVHNRELWAMQNWSSSSDPANVFLDKKRLIVFSKDRWNVIN